MKLVLVVLVVFYLTTVQCVSKKQQKKCQKNLSFIEKSCTSKGYQPPPEITCHFTITEPKKKKKKTKYKKKKCRKAADYCVENCPHYHCGSTTTPPPLKQLTTVPCSGSVSFGTTEAPGGGGDPCVVSVPSPTSPEGWWWE